MRLLPPSTGGDHDNSYLGWRRTSIQQQHNDSKRNSRASEEPFWNAHDGIRRFVGLDITRKREERKIFITRTEFITRMLNKFKMESCHPRDIPADPSARLTPSMSPANKSEELLMETTPYQEAVACLIYFMSTSRPDIAFATNQAARFSHNPGPAHWEGVKRILAYLSWTRYYGLCFSGSTNNSILAGFTDADYVGDIETRRSTTGFVFMLNNGPVAWGCKRQKFTSLSTTESEYVAACESTREAVCLKRLLIELGLQEPSPVTLLCDNQSAVRLVRNPDSHNALNT